VVVDGSSTVQPLTAVAAKLFEAENPNVKITVGTSGTGGGFDKFCAGQTDISNASRSISAEERARCDANGISFEEMQVANDALTVVVNKANTWASCLTVEQLKRIWEPGSTVKNWNQVDPNFPDEPLTLFGPGADSGTFDYFTGVINGQDGASRTDYSASEDDNILVQGVQGSRGGLGYFGFSYYEENAATLNALQIDGGQGCVAPSSTSVQDASYAPLSRPLYIYPSSAAIAKPQVAAFVEYYLEQDERIVEAARFVPMTPPQKQVTAAELDALRQPAGR
jgi:phosphate transport system substrate-binding protein